MAFVHSVDRTLIISKNALPPSFLPPSKIVHFALCPRKSYAEENQVKKKKKKFTEKKGNEKIEINSINVIENTSAGHLGVKVSG